MAFPELTTLQWSLSGISALLVGLSKAGFGTGAGILAVPLMVTVLGPEDMLPVMLLVLITGDVFSLVHYVRLHDRRNLGMLVPGMLGGILAGALLLDWFLGLPDSQLWLKRMIGCLSVAFVGLQFCRMVQERRLGTQGKPYQPLIWHGIAIGACAGVTSTLAHAGGPLIALFLLPQRIDRRTFVGTLVKYFFIGNMLKLVPYFRQGLMTGDRFLLALVLLPCVLVGTLIGVWMNRRFNDRVFRLVVYCLALTVGAYLLSGWEVGGGHRAEDGRAVAPGVLFRSGLRAYDRADFTGAAEDFGAVAGTGGPLRERALFNLAVSLYAAGRHGEAESRLRALRSAVDPVLKLRAGFNRGNCAYRTARYARAAQHYSETVELCKAYLATAGHAAVAGGTVREVLSRAEFNLALARAPQQTVQVPAGSPTGRPADADRGDPGTRQNGAQPMGVPELGQVRLEEAATGRVAEGAEGARTVPEVLAGALSGDTGPVLKKGPARRSPGGRNW